MSHGSDPIRVMIVDDSAAARSALSRLLSADPEIAVIATAADAYQAAEKMRKQLPDVLLLDLALPRMDGLTFLRRIMAQHPMPVVICSSLTAKGSENALKALSCGAAEVIAKPRMGSEEERAEAQMHLCDAVTAAAATIGGRKPKASAAAGPGPKLTADAILPPMPPRPNAGPPDGEVIAIGASTGGTEALLRVLSALPADIPPIVVVQHMPEHFTRTFAQRLDKLCRPKVSEARNGDWVHRGAVLIAPGNQHMMLRRSGAGYVTEVVPGPCVSRHRPSVDVLFRSVAQAAGNKAIGAILTGMGDDGARGLREMKEAGATTIAQDEASSVVFGMPKEAIRHGGVDRVTSLDGIAGELRSWAARHARH